MGKDKSDGRSKEKLPERPEEGEVQSSIRTGESGPMDTIKAQEGLEDPNNIIFGDREADLYTVGPEDPKPRRLDQKRPPTDLEESRQVTTQDYEEESYVATPPDEPRPGPLRPERSKKDSEKET